MPSFINQGINLYYRDRGAGEAVIFLHEFGGDARSWDYQMNYLSHHGSLFRTLALNARGYPPSDVPETADAYGWKENRDDVIALLDNLQIEKAHMVGLSMGGYIALMLGLAAPERCLSVVCASGGSGAHPPTREAFILDSINSAERIFKYRQIPAEGMASAPNRIQLKHKNEAAWQQFRQHLSDRPYVGAAYTLSEVQAKRPSLHDFADQLTRLTLPVLLLCGDEDEPCLDVNLWLKRTLPLAGLKIYPQSGHLLNLEMPDQFSEDILSFFKAVADGHWRRRPEQAFTSMFESGK